MPDVFDALIQRLNKYKLITNADMSAYTSFRAGGKAAALMEADGVDSVRDAIFAANELNVPYYVIGNGTNLLVSDCGLDALVIRIGDGMSDIVRSSDNNCSFRAYAGASLAALARLSVEAGCSGLEWAAGIPGTVGGAVAMNAGAYGGEIKQVLKSVDVIVNGVLFTQPVGVNDMGYRSSMFRAPDRIVTAALFELSPDDGAALERMREFNAQRKLKQPLSYPSAGSTFKRPAGHFAGKLIEDAGLKGLCVGAAQVSELHAGFIVNRGGSSASDIYKLIRLVQQRVFEHSGVELQTEVMLLGEFGE